MCPSFADQLELFYGCTDPGAARIYAQLPAGESTPALQLGGSVYGPVCPYACTLPARFSLTDAGPGPTVLAQGVIQDPCFWSAEMPYLYTATLELRREGQVVAQVDRLLGIRLLVAQRDRLEWEREPYTLRGVYRPELSLSDLPELHASGTAVLVPQPSDEICCEASRCGALLLALVTGTAEQVIVELRRLSCWPAVGVAVIDVDLPPSVALRSAARNLLLAQVVQTSDQAAAPWADMLVVRDGVADRELASRIGIEKPIAIWSNSLLQQI